MNQDGDKTDEQWRALGAAAGVWMGGRVRALWGRIPEKHWEVGLLWACGLALGVLGFRASLALPWPAALACWGAAAGLGLLLAGRAEPILWEAAEAAAAPDPTRPAPEPVPDPTTPTPRVRSLLDLVAVPGGVFTMGSPPASEEQIAAYARDWTEAFGGELEKQMDDLRRWLGHEQPAHRVHLSPFLMARIPVTRGQWRAVMPEAPAEWSKPGEDDDLPATDLDWPRALAFCNALSEREGLPACYRQDQQGEWQWDRGAAGYRLPTEAEWEHACRAGTQTQWFWGDDPAGTDAHAWYHGNSGDAIKPVGGKAANPWGLHDLSGLVYEWCWDRFGAYPPETEPPPQDPAGPQEGATRVVRGGSFFGPPVDLRSAVRVDVRPGGRGDDLGLRCVRSRARQP